MQNHYSYYTNSPKKNVISVCFSPPGPTWSRTDEASQRLPFRTICWYSRWSTWGPLLPESKARTDGPLCHSSHWATILHCSYSDMHQKALAKVEKCLEQEMSWKVFDGRAKVILIFLLFFGFGFKDWPPDKTGQISAAIWCHGYNLQPCRNISSHTNYNNLAGLSYLISFLHLRFVHTFRSCAMPKRDRRDQAESPVATRPKANPPSRPERWTNRESSRQPEASRHNEPFNVFSQSATTPRDCSPHTDESSRHKVHGSPIQIGNSSGSPSGSPSHWFDIMENIDSTKYRDRTNSRLGSDTCTRSCLAIIQFTIVVIDGSTKPTTSTTIVHSFSTKWRSDYQCSWRTTGISKGMVFRCDSIY